MSCCVTVFNLSMVSIDPTLSGIVNICSCAAADAAHSHTAVGWPRCGQRTAFPAGSKLGTLRWGIAVWRSLADSVAAQPL